MLEWVNKPRERLKVPKICNGAGRLVWCTLSDSNDHELGCLDAHWCATKCLVLDGIAHCFEVLSAEHGLKAVPLLPECG